jgi:hypothetical protein
MLVSREGEVYQREERREKKRRRKRARSSEKEALKGLAKENKR